MLISLRTHTLNPLFNDTYNRPGPSADFFAVYHSGRQVLTGRNPYDMDEEPRYTPEFAPFRYPPGVAFTLGVSVAWVKPWVAYGGWLVVLELFLLLNLWLVRRLIPHPRQRDVVTAGWLMFTPLYVELWMGQFTFATCTLLLLAFVSWRDGRSRLAAGLWAVATSAKLFGLAWIPWLARRRRWAALACGAGTLAAAMSWFLWYPDMARLFVRLNFTGVDLAGFHAGNFGLQALVYEVVGPVPASQWRSIATAVNLAIVALATIAMIRHAESDDRVSVAIALLLLPLISKHAWEHHYVVVLPAFTLLVAAWHDNLHRLVAIAIAYAVVCLPSLLIVLQDGAPTWHPERQWSQLARIAYHAPKPLAVLAVFGLCVQVQLAKPTRGSRAPGAKGSG